MKIHEADDWQEILAICDEDRAQGEKENQALVALKEDGRNDWPVHKLQALLAARKAS